MRGRGVGIRGGDLLFAGGEKRERKGKKCKITCVAVVLKIDQPLIA